MLLQLTNASQNFDGATLLINTDMALSIYRGRQMDSNSIPTDKEVTIIFMPPYGSWEVKETPEEIAKLLKESK